MTVVTLPYTFVGGTRAIADQVNADFNAIANAINTNINITLQSATTFYVSPTGADIAGNGLSAASPAATITWLYGQIQNLYDLNMQVATIQLANGTYNESVRIRGPIPGAGQALQVVIQGNMGSPNLVIINGDPAFLCHNGALLSIQGVTLQSTVSSGIIADYHARVLFSTINCGSVVMAHLFAARGGLIQANGNYTITAGGQAHAQTAESGLILLDNIPVNYIGVGTGAPTINLTGTPAFSNAFVVATGLGMIRIGAVFTGTAATGTRASANLNGVINTAGQGQAYLPGNATGTPTNGGQIV